MLLLALPLSAAAQDAYGAKTYPRGAAKKLIVETDSGAITLKQPIDGPVAVDVSPAAAPGDDCRVSQELKGTTLRLTARANRNAFGMSKSCRAGFKVTGYFEEIEARSGSGDVSDEVLARKAELKTGSGAIRVRTNSDLVLRAGSGTISGEAGGAKLDAATGSGDVGLSALAGLATVRTGSGAVSLDWTSVPPSGTIEVRTGSGSLSAAFPKYARLKTDVRSGSGRIRDDFDDKDAKLALEFKSGSGDASVTRKP